MSRSSSQVSEDGERGLTGVHSGFPRAATFSRGERPVAPRQLRIRRFQAVDRCAWIGAGPARPLASLLGQGSNATQFRSTDFARAPFPARCLGRRDRSVRRRSTIPINPPWQPSARGRGSTRHNAAQPTNGIRPRGTNRIVPARRGRSRTGVHSRMRIVRAFV
jgi:hypothetical protein